MTEEENINRHSFASTCLRGITDTAHEEGLDVPTLLAGFLGELMLLRGVSGEDILSIAEAAVRNVEKAEAAEQAASKPAILHA